MMGLYRFWQLEDRPFELSVAGRDEWALRALIRAGEKGCTPIDNPAPRWSAYVHNLRRLGIPIETLTERHGGNYPGNHARYVLRCKAVCLEAVNG